MTRTKQTARTARVRYGRGRLNPVGRSRGAASDSRRGAALLIAIIVLTALFLLAIPFAAFMRRQHASGTQALHTARARYAEAGALSHARVVLCQGLSNIEDPANPFPFNDPNVDTLWEFRVTLRTTADQPLGFADLNGDGIDDIALRTFQVADALGLPNDGDQTTVDGFIRVDHEWMAYSHVAGLTPSATTGTLTVLAEHRGLFGTTPSAHIAGVIVSFFRESELWHLDVEDQQARININTAPYQVILNLLGYLGIGDEAGVPAPAPGDANFPNDRQQNLAAAISSYRIYYSYWEGLDPGSAITDGSYTRFQNINMLKNISTAPWFSGGGGLSGPELDLLLPYVTVHSEPAAGADLWLTLGGISLAADINPTVAPPPLDATVEWAARLNNASRVPLGSVVRLWDPDNLILDPTARPEYRLVTAVNEDITLGGAGLLGLSAASGGGGWIDVTEPVAGALSRFRQVKPTLPGDNPATTHHTPGYLYIDDGVNSEWIEYSEVDPVGLQIRITKRNVFDPANPNPGGDYTGHAHASGVSMRGNVISWRYLDSTGGNYTAPVTFHYSSGTTQVAIESRHAININTVGDPIVLKSVLQGITDGTNEIDPTEAENIALCMLAYTSSGTAPSLPPAPPPYEFFDGDEVWFDPSAWGTDTAGDLEDLLDNKLVTAGIIAGGAGSEAEMLVDNFQSVAAHWPQVSTVPLRFDSGTLIGIRSLGVVDDRAGTPIASAAIGRVYDVVPPLEGLSWALRTQQEFYEWMVATGQRVQDGGQILSSFLNEDLPAALLMADDRYTKPASPTGIQWGFVAPALDTLNPTVYTTVLEGLHENPVLFHLDYALGQPDPQAGSATPSSTNTRATGITDARLTYATDHDGAVDPVTLKPLRNIQADSFHATIQPFAIECWVKPPTADDPNGELEAGDEPQYLVDIGAGSNLATAPNQVRLYMEWRQVLGVDKLRLILRMDDETGKGCVQAWSSNDFDFDPGVWHHVAVAVVGTFRNEIAIFIDGIYDRDMFWGYWHTSSPVVDAPDETPLTVQEAYFWPVAASVPNIQYTLANNYPPGTTQIALNGPNPGDTDLLGASGWIVIRDATDGNNIYRFNDRTGNVLTLDPAVHGGTLNYPYAAGEFVASLIPIVQTGVHQVPAPAPQLNNLVRFYAHTNLTSTSPATDAFAYESASPQITVQNVQPEPPRLHWLAFDPNNDPPITVLGAGLLDVHASRWKVLNDAADLLSGVLPCGYVGDFSVGGNASGTEQFEGQMDELRITSLPTALVEEAGWTGGGTSATVREWTWFPGYADTKDGATNPLYDATGSPLHPTGGYFAVEGRLYSYQTYDWPSGQIAGIAEVDADLTPTLNALSAHTGLHRIIPLSFITSTRLALPIGAADIVIPVWDVSQFPESGYVRIDDEIIAYSSRDPDNNELILSTDPTVASAYPRGAYGTTASAHIQHPVLGTWPVVRHVPVRHLDRYRVEDELYIGPWAKHQAYSDAQLGADMCMLSVSVNHAGQVERVAWRFKEPLEDGQKVIVLVLIDPDGAVPWNTDPNDDGDGDDTTSGDTLWGTIIQEPAPTDGELVLHTATGDYPTASTGVEVRFYFDLGDTHPYNCDFAGGPPYADRGWSNMVELDEVVIEMVPRPMSF